MKNSDEIIVITAAGTGTWLREKFTPSGLVRMMGEGIFSDYKEKMNLLREVDNNIYEWAKELDDKVKEARKAAKDRRYVDVAVILGQLNNRLNSIRNEQKRVQEVADEAIKEFELKHNKYPIPEGGQVIQAGWFDDKKREWMLRRFENKAREQRRLAVNTLIDSTAVTVNNVKAYVKELGKARASGDIGKYLSILKDISLEQQKFLGKFRPVYNAHLQPLVEAAYKAQQEAAEQQMQAMPKGEVPADPPPPAEIPDFSGPRPEAKPAAKPVVDLGPLELPEGLSRIEEFTEDSGHGAALAERPEPVTIPMESSKDDSVKSVSEVVTNRLPEKIDSDGMVDEGDEPPPAVRVPAAPLKGSESTLLSNIAHLQIETGVRNAFLIKKHSEFMKELSKVSKLNDKAALAQTILKHAEEIEDLDTNTSINLIKFVDGLLNDK